MKIKENNHIDELINTIEDLFDAHIDSHGITFAESPGVLAVVKDRILRQMHKLENDVEEDSE